MSIDGMVVVILSGGSGSRLWPVSRDMHPKQLVSLNGGDTLLQASMRRASDCPTLAGAKSIVVCQESYRFVVAQQLESLNQQCRIILEPIGRNTAPALTLAALQALDDAEDAILVVMPSDHALSNPEGLEPALASAAKLARGGAVVTLGVKPTAPETGFGYIRCGELLVDSLIAPAWTIAEFAEKPTAILAKTFLNSGDYFWNAGIFILRASVWLLALRRFRPDILESVSNAWTSKSQDIDFTRITLESFALSPNVSIDYAVMEPLARAQELEAPSLPKGAVVALNAGWSDVGSWSAVWEHLSKDHSGNAQQGDVLMRETSGSLVIAQHRLVVCNGVENLIVVETPDAVLVMNKHRAQEVKNVVELLRQNGRSEWQVHQKVHRPWGWYDSVDAGDRFQVKRILVRPGATLSLQMHHHRAEHWIVVKGTAKVTCAEKSFLLSENESTFIPLGKTHRLENPGRVDLEMIEVQSGSYLGEDDIVRFDDAYGRS